MSIIVPAILSSTRKDFGRKLAVLDGLSQSVQIDVIDGKFVAPATWPYVDSEKLGIPTFSSESGDMFPYLGELDYEIDLMVSAPEEVIGAWIEAGACRITIHAESTKDLTKVFEDMRVKYGHEKNFAPGLLSVGVALNIDTETSLIEPYLDNVDYVQFMGIAKIGRQGEAFDTRVLRKIKIFRAKYPDMLIQVDGGVSLDTAPLLLKAGVKRLIIGSGIWKSVNPIETIEKFSALAQEFGLYE